jgi:hypothetical protein
MVVDTNELMPHTVGRFPVIRVEKTTVIVPNHVAHTNIPLEDIIQPVHNVDDRNLVMQTLHADSPEGTYDIGPNGEGLPRPYLVASLLGRLSLDLRDEMDETKVAPTVEAAIAQGRLQRLHTQWAESDIIQLSSHHSFEDMLATCSAELTQRQVTPRVIGLVGKSGHGKDSFAAELKRSEIVGNVYEVSLGGYFRMLSRAVLFQAYKEGYISSMDDGDQVSRVLKDKALVQDIVSRIEMSDKAIQPVKDDVSRTTSAEYTPQMNEDETFYKGIWDKTAALMDRAVPIIAEASQEYGISYAQRAVTLLDEQLPEGSVILIQGRKYTLQCIAQFDAIIQIENTHPWQVGFRRFQDKVAAVVRERIMTEQYPHLDKKLAKKMIPDSDIPAATNEEDIYAAYESLWKDVTTIRTAINGAKR